MNKTELIEEVSNKTGLTKKDTGNVIDALTDTIQKTLSKEEKVILVDFGTFRVMERKARRGVNPRTRETIRIPAKKVPKFRVGKGLGGKVR